MNPYVTTHGRELGVDHQGHRYYTPNLNIVSEWDGDYHSAQYTAKHGHKPADLGAFMDHMEEHYKDRRDTPAMGGVAESGNSAVYGTSSPSWGKPSFTPKHQRPQHQRLRHDNVQNRLNEFMPVDAFLHVPGPNLVGSCCEYVTLKPLIPGKICTLRNVASQASTLRGGRKPSVFCIGCGIHAQAMADRFPGLRITDCVNGMIYESRATAQAFQFEASGMPKEQINQVDKWPYTAPNPGSGQTRTFRSKSICYLIVTPALLGYSVRRLRSSTEPKPTLTPKPINNPRSLAARGMLLRAARDTVPVAAATNCSQGLQIVVLAFYVF
ncbi:hypothetical protein C8R47DRAFT_1196682 [Mycena vitilis]|nr:hypothetical protein C8R47DRAFT_1196682 [Mycena vitilis]